MQLREIGEFGLIQRIKKWTSQNREEILLGIDDDAAALKLSPGKILLLTTDTFVEGVHFDLNYYSFYQLGWRVMAANLSDIAAMGGLPLYALVSLAIPEEVSVESIQEIYCGLKKMGEKYGVAVIGGDTTASKDSLHITLTVVGEVEEEHLTPRSGAKVGDLICVTGDLGAAQAGLKILKSGGALDRERYAILAKKHLSPEPRVGEARYLVEHLKINAMIDVSDGLASEVNHICLASGVGAEVYRDKIPLSPLTQEVALGQGDVPLDYALKAGEDFELLFTTETIQPIEKAFQIEFGLNLTIIGRVLPAERGIVLLDRNGRRTPLDRLGYDHFGRKD